MTPLKRQNVDNPNFGKIFRTNEQMGYKGEPMSQSSKLLNRNSTPEEVIQWFEMNGFNSLKETLSGYSGKINYRKITNKKVKI